MDVPIPIAGAKARYTSTSRLVRYETVDGVRSAVIESEGDVVLDHIVSHLRDLMASTANSNQLPAGIDPTVQLDGSMHMYETTWLDTHHNLLVKSEGSGDGRQVGAFGAQQEGQEDHGAAKEVRRDEQAEKQEDRRGPEPHEGVAPPRAPRPTAAGGVP